ncbi:ASCH domain-containing protein [Verrucomicrobium spinosum]|uniref:ASCH domain-containing protein n=1 Tax=Verrucomicrobium spinosum TaxID=2736 RepID=UPI00155DA95E
MSIKPKYADLIFSGAKTVELRRVCPKLKPGDLVLVYASGPRMALIGKFEVKGILSGKKSAFYDEFGASSGISRAEFNSYFSGVATAHGIQIGRTWKLKPETSLNVLRRRFEAFTPLNPIAICSSLSTLVLPHLKETSLLPPPKADSMRENTA